MSFAKPTFQAQKQAASQDKDTSHCKAHNCKMPAGVVIAGQAFCAWHHGANVTDYHRITQVIEDWNVISREIVIGRRILCDQIIGAKPGAIDDAFGHAVDRVQHIFAEWPEVAPQASKSGHFDDYRSWVDRLSRFLTIRTTEVMRKTIPVRAGAKTSMEPSVWERVERLMTA